MELYNPESSVPFNPWKANSQCRHRDQPSGVDAGTSLSWGDRKGRWGGDPCVNPVSPRFQGVARGCMLAWDRLPWCAIRAEGLSCRQELLFGGSHYPPGTPSCECIYWDPFSSQLRKPLCWTQTLGTQGVGRRHPRGSRKLHVHGPLDQSWWATWLLLPAEGGGGCSGHAGRAQGPQAA